MMGTPGSHKLMGQPVVGDGLDRRVAVYHLLVARGRRVAVVDGLDVVVQHTAQLGQAVDEAAGDGLGTRKDVAQVGLVAGPVKAQACCHLRLEHGLEPLALQPYHILQVVAVHIVAAEKTGEKQLATHGDNLLYHVLTGQRLAAETHVAHALCGGDVGQLVHCGLELGLVDISIVTHDCVS
jgi:hypothetical protein